MTVRVGVADDQAMIRDGLRMQIAHTPDLEWVGEATTGQEAITLARTAHPDVLVMDVRMPVMDGIDATRHIVEDPDMHDVRVLVLTTFDLDDYVFGALRAGASGFLLKDSSPEELGSAIRVVAEGGALLTPDITRRLIAEFASQPAQGRPSELVERLTPRETEVLELVARGLSNAEIAQRLVLSPLTAKTHVSRILSKLGLRDRAQLVVVAYEAGVVIRGRNHPE